MSYIEQARQKGLAKSAEDFVRSQVMENPQTAFDNEVMQANKALRGSGTPQGLVEMGLNPEAVQTAMKQINDQSLALMRQNQASIGQINNPEGGLYQMLNK